MARFNTNSNNTTVNAEKYVQGEGFAFRLIPWAKKEGATDSKSKCGVSLKLRIGAGGTEGELTTSQFSVFVTDKVMKLAPWSDKVGDQYWERVHLSKEAFEVIENAVLDEYERQFGNPWA